MITVRDWQLEDIDMLLDWVREEPGILEGLRMEDSSELELRSWMLIAEQSPQQAWFVMERDGEVLGIAGMNPIAGTMAVCHQIKSPRQKGLRVAFDSAAAAMEHAMDTHQLEKLVAFVPEDHKVALRLDQKLGFKDIAVRTLVYERNNNGT